jgi:hypothetical protein
VTTPARRPCGGPRPAPRRGCSTTTRPGPATAGGTRVVFPRARRRDDHGAVMRHKRGVDVGQACIDWQERRRPGAAVAGGDHHW